MITVRKVLVNEIEALREFYKECSSFRINNGSEFIVAFKNNQPLGFAKIALKRNIAEIIMIYVNPKERGQGLGDAILRTTLNCIEKYGYLWVLTSDNPHLNHFFIKEGFILLEDVIDFEDFKCSIEKYNPSDTYCCKIPEFFQKGCRK